MNRTHTNTRGAASEVGMKRRSETLAREFAHDIAELMPEARRAYGQQKQGSSTREASDTVNALLIEYEQQGGNITELAEHLEGVISLPGLRRRIRVARSGNTLGQDRKRSFRGDRDPKTIEDWAAKVRDAHGTPEYGRVFREAYDSGAALSAVAEAVGVSYYTAWSSMSTTSAQQVAEPEPLAS